MRLLDVMADVVNIADFRREKKPQPSASEIAAFSVTSVMAEWERFAKSNKLSEFVNSSLGAYAKPFTNYLANLTEIAAVEEKIGLSPGVWAPGVTGGVQFGWRASFRFGEVLVETPDMASEAYARCCNILIFQKIKREFIAANT
jgi:hypothetical protein